MAGKQGYHTTLALEWIKSSKKRYPSVKLSKTYWIKQAAAKFTVHETTLWRALSGKQANGKRR